MASDVRPTRRFREMLASGQLIKAPGALNPFFARIVEQEGFEAVHLMGSGVAAGVAGEPDLGLVTLSEMATMANRVAMSVSIPVICDADTGFGGPLNVMRAVREFERAGVAAIHIEDQEWPKRCGHFQGKRLVPRREMEQKLRAAADARRDEDFVIIARVDAIAVEGFDAAVERANAYLEAGADAIWVEAPATLEQMEQAPRLINGPLMYSVASSAYGGKSPSVSVADLQQMGYRIAIFAAGHLLSITRAQQDWLRELKRSGLDDNHMERMARFDEFFRVMGFQEAMDLQDRYQAELQLTD